MSGKRIHRAVSDDGTEIAGYVDGDGPPLVLVHGSLADGDIEWGGLLPWLRERFSCYVMHTRCRATSGHSNDLTPERLVQDVTAFVDSVGAPVRLAGISNGGMLALGAAARSRAVTAVAVWEPVVLEAATEQLLATFQVTVEQMSSQYAAGQAVEAARTFYRFICHDDEIAALDAAGTFADTARYVPVDIAEATQATADGTSPTDPTVLKGISAPVLLLRGGESKQREWFTAGVEFALAHLPDARAVVVPDAGHLPLLRPELAGPQLRDYFTSHPA